MRDYSWWWSLLILVAAILYVLGATHFSVLLFGFIFGWGLRGIYEGQILKRKRLRERVEEILRDRAKEGL